MRVGAGRLAGKSIIVTAAASGIGAAVLEAVAAQGAQVLAVDIDATGLDSGAERLGSDRLTTHVADVTSEDGARRAVDAAVTGFGRLDGLVNVVGGSRPGRTIGEIGLDDWEDVVRFNLTGTYLMCRFAVPALEAAGGAVVNISSGAGVHGMPANPAYCAAKAGVIGLTKALAIDHGPRGVRVNCVAPGAILTPLMERNRSPEEIAAFGRVSTSGRVGRPDEIAAVVTFLLSDEASYVSGETISVHGGRA